jgi:hypothetical protein
MASVILNESEVRDSTMRGLGWLRYFSVQRRGPEITIIMCVDNEAHSLLHPYRVTQELVGQNLIRIVLHTADTGRPHFFL